MSIADSLGTFFGEDLAQNVQNAYAPLLTSAGAVAGGAPTASDFLAARGLGKAQQAAAARANSTRGQFGLANAQKGAQATGAEMSQESIYQNAARKADEEARARALQAQLTTSEQKDLLSARNAQMAQSNAIAGGLLSVGGMLAGKAGSGGGGGSSGGVTQSSNPFAAFASPASQYQDPSTTGPNAAQWNQVNNLENNVPANTPDRGQESFQAAFPTQQWAGSDTPGLSDQTQPVSADTSAALNGDQSWAQADQLSSEAPEEMHSDKRLKTPMGGPNESHAEQFLDHLHPQTYKWKNPSDAPNPNAAQTPNLGVYAQDVEKGPEGHSIVQDTPHGKVMDLHALTGALAAGAGALKKKSDMHDQRLSRIEHFMGLRNAG